jgi:sterol desaturase/sphingolipid hydroxylase (fatty acid hydroxylase superfamily)
MSSSTPFSPIVYLVAIYGSLGAAFIWEMFAARRTLVSRKRYRRLGNIGVWLFNFIVAGLLFVEPVVGLRHWYECVVGFLFLDLLAYTVHRTLHVVPRLWQLHTFHHSDQDIDTTTSVRHHPIEAFLMNGCFWSAAVLLDIPSVVVAVYGLTVFILAVGTHANVRWPAWLEAGLRLVVITPDLHAIHHSIDTIESNKNFGAVFSVWDRLFRTFIRMSTRRVDTLVFGVVVPVVSRRNHMSHSKPPYG